MRLVHVVPSVADEASGPSYSVPRLCEALGSAGHEVHLHALGRAGVRMRGHFVLHEHAWNRHGVFARAGFSAPLRRELRAAAGGADVVHNHSLWMMPNLYPALAVRGNRCLLVSSPRGTLSAWALDRHRLVKRLLWLGAQGPAMRASDAFHATADSELEDIRRAGLGAPVAVIPNGVDLPALDVPARRPGDRRRLLFLGRIHPKKGVDLLLRAWAALEEEHDCWDLVVVGPDDGAAGALQALSRELGLTRVRFSGPVFGAEKEATYQAADLFVLPTHSENFGMAVAEALANGVPAITTHGAPWASLERERCGWWIPVGVQPLVECLRHVLGLSHEALRDHGLRGRAHMERDYGWESIGWKMSETYRWMRAGGRPPDWVDVGSSRREP